MSRCPLSGTASGFPVVEKALLVLHCKRQYIMVQDPNLVPAIAQARTADGMPDAEDDSEPAETRSPSIASIGKPRLTSVVEQSR